MKSPDALAQTDFSWWLCTAQDGPGSRLLSAPKDSAYNGKYAVYTGQYLEVIEINHQTVTHCGVKVAQLQFLKLANEGGWVSGHNLKLEKGLVDTVETETEATSTWLSDNGFGTPLTEDLVFDVIEAMATPSVAGQDELPWNWAQTAGQWMLCELLPGAHGELSKYSILSFLF